MMQFKKMALKDLEPNKRNPRNITSANFGGLSRSIGKFGLVQPIVWNKRSGRVVGGHQRLEVLKESGEKTAMTAIVDLDESDELALNVALNNKHIEGEYTDDLQAILSEIQETSEALFVDLNFSDLLETLAEEAEEKAEPDEPSNLSNRTFVVTPEQDKVVNEAMERVHKHGVFVAEGNNNDHGNELSSICAYFLDWSAQLDAE